MTYYADLTSSYASVSSRLRGPEKSSVVRRARPAPAEIVPTARPLRRLRDVMFIPPSGDVVADFDIPALAWKRIIMETSVSRAIPIEEIVGPHRNRAAVAARDEAAWRMFTELQMTMPQIGRRLGGRDHTTIYHSLKKSRALAAAQKEIAA